MKKILFILFLFMGINSFALTIGGNLAHPTSITDVKSILKKYGQNDLEKVLREFLQISTPSRFVGTKGHQKAIEYIIGRIKTLQKNNKDILLIDDFTPDLEGAVKMYQADFNREVASKLPPNNPTYILWNNYTNSIISTVSSLKGIRGKNIVWEKRGTKSPQDVLILGAHFDTISVDKSNYTVKSDVPMPGADNNGSGIALLLAMVEVLQQLELEKTVKIVFFDFEDIGYLGSKHFSKKYVSDKKNNVVGLINPIMIGHDSVVTDKTNKHGNMKFYGRLNNSLDLSFGNKMIDLGKKINDKVNFDYLGNGFKGTSGVSFWNYDFPVIVATHDRENDPNDAKAYTKNDFFETLNLKTMHNSFMYLAGAVIAWANDLK